MAHSHLHTFTTSPHHIQWLLPWLTVTDLHALRQTSHEWAADPTLAEWLQRRKPLRQMVRRWTRAPLLAHFDDTFLAPFVRHCDVPVLAFQNRFCGGTDYLDGIVYSDFTHPLMIGVDRYRRPYLCVMYHWLVGGGVGGVGGVGFDSATTKTRMLTVFQRYTDSPFTWCRIGCNKQPLLGEHIDTCLSPVAKTTLLRNLFRLVGGGDVQVGWLGEGTGDVEDEDDE